MKIIPENTNNQPVERGNQSQKLSDSCKIIIASLINL